MAPLGRLARVPCLQFGRSLASANKQPTHAAPAPATGSPAYALLAERHNARRITKNHSFANFHQVLPHKYSPTVPLAMQSLCSIAVCVTVAGGYRQCSYTKSRLLVNLLVVGGKTVCYTTMK